MLVGKRKVQHVHYPPHREQNVMVSRQGDWQDNEDAYLGIAAKLAAGELPQVNDGFRLLYPIFRGHFQGDPAFVDWLNEQIERLSNGTVHLTRSNESPGVMGPGGLFVLSGPNWSKKLFIGPYDDGIEWRR